MSKYPVVIGQNGWTFHEVNFNDWQIDSNVFEHRSWLSRMYSWYVDHLDKGLGDDLDEDLGIPLEDELVSLPDNQSGDKSGENDSNVDEKPTKWLNKLGAARSVEPPQYATTGCQHEDPRRVVFKVLAVRDGKTAETCEECA